MSRARGALIDRLGNAPVTADPSALEVAREQLSTLLEGSDSTELAARVRGRESVPNFLAAVMANSPHLRELIQRRPQALARILADDPRHRLDALAATAEAPFEGTESELMTRLRAIKAEAALLIALADIGGVWSVDEVTAALSRIADVAVGAGVRYLLADGARTGKLTPTDRADPVRDCGYFVIAMGKHGARELNYSSDIDLIVFYDRDRVTLADPLDAGPFFVRLTKRLVKIMQERTQEGYVFRMDLRLRPDPGATPVAMSVAAALQYYESMGQNWERAALIKARAIAGDIPAGEAFLAELRPFIWRKFFDYAAIADVHSIKRQIHAHKGHGRIAVKGHNVKLGRGGIREIEFFVQTQQLIAGGRNPGLRGRGTLQMMERLAEEGWIEPATRDELSAAYRFLRKIEHAIQMVGDEQTQLLPTDDAGLARVSALCGFQDNDAFAAALTRTLTAVQGHYAHLFENAPGLSSDLGNLVFTGDEDDPETLETLANLGYKRPQDVTRTIRAWHYGRYAATRSTRAREKLTEMTPVLLDAFAKTENADEALISFDRFLGHLPAGAQVFQLLAQDPGVLKLLSVIMGAAPRLSRLVERRSHVLAALLEPELMGELSVAQEMRKRFLKLLGEARGYEDKLDRARIFGQEQMFLTGVRLVSGAITPSMAGRAYTALADLLVDELFRAASEEFALRHGRVPGGRTAIVAMGKLGGREMTAGSDLDLILLYDHDPDATQSDGDKPLAPSQYYIRLTQRLVAALSAPTGEGTLYEVDFRLRPSGRAGPLATSFSAFEAYQKSEAWTWEQMALTRMRVVCGDSNLRERLLKVKRAALDRPRDADTVRREVADMRARIAREKGSADPWDIKNAAGGLIDVEFVAQTLQLLHGGDRPEILSQSTRKVLRAAAEAGLLPPNDAEVLRSGFALYQALTQVLRLAIDGRFDPETAHKGLRDLLASAAELPDFATLDAHLRATQAAVRECFSRLVGEAEPDAARAG